MIVDAEKNLWSIHLDRMNVITWLAMIRLEQIDRWCLFHACSFILDSLDGWYSLVSICSSPHMSRFVDVDIRAKSVFWYPPVITLK